MRTTRLLAIAALAALPLGATVASAAPAVSDAVRAISTTDAGSPVINVRKDGGGGGPKFSGGPRGPRFAGNGPRHWKGGPGHWNGNHGRHHGHFRPRWYGIPYYYGGYYPNYYYDDSYYEDDDDDVVVYSQNGDDVARCEARYRSFDPASGTFLGNDGLRHVCPYLR
jgi:hypothetical protein